MERRITLKWRPMNFPRFETGGDYVTVIYRYNWNSHCNMLLGEGGVEA